MPRGTHYNPTEIARELINPVLTSSFSSSFPLYLAHTFLTQDNFKRESIIMAMNNGLGNLTAHSYTIL